MEKKTTKKKLTLSISGKKTHSVPHYAQSRGKTSVVIEKKPQRRWGEKKLQPKDNFNKPKSTSDVGSKKISVGKNFDIKKFKEKLDPSVITFP